MAFELDTGLGKGSHYRLTLGSGASARRTTLKSGRYDPGYVRLVCRQLGIPPDEL